MTRFSLSAALWAGVLVVGAITAIVQVQNFKDAAELDCLVDETQWNLRRCSGLTSELERFEFELSAEHTRGRGAGAQLPRR